MKESEMADANARRAAIKQASYQVRTGNAFVRRAANIKSLSATQTVAKSTPSPRKNARS